MDREKAAAKSRILAKGRKIERDIQRYATYGFVTELDAWEADDRRLTRAVDGLFDSARKAGIHDDPELMTHRQALFQARVAARERAQDSRRQLLQGRADALGGERRKVPAGMQGYLDEISLGDAKRRARRGKG